MDRPRKLDRERLSLLLQRASTISGALAKKSLLQLLTDSLPPNLRPLLTPLASRWEIPSAMYAALTRLADGLDDDDIWTLSQWLNDLVLALYGRDVPARTLADLEHRELAVAKLRELVK